MTTLKPGSFDDLEQLDGVMENLDIHIDEVERHRFAHHLASASFSKDSMGYVRAFINYIEGEKMAVLVNVLFGSYTGIATPLLTCKLRFGSTCFTVF
jgi:hypothetical protein